MHEITDGVLGEGEMHPLVDAAITARWPEAPDSVLEAIGRSFGEVYLALLADGTANTSAVEHAAVRCLEQWVAERHRRHPQSDAIAQIAAGVSDSWHGSLEDLIEVARLLV